MNVRRIVIVLIAGFFLSLYLPSIYARDDADDKKKALDEASAMLVGLWEIFQTKEVGKPYLPGYKGHPFVTKGANAFTLIFEYRKDGTFRRVSRIGPNETVHEGTWKLVGHELRHQRPGAAGDEVMYVRFDNPNQYTSMEVYEDTPDPGLFAQFKRTR